jgi:exonuclease VII large subunit
LHLSEIMKNLSIVPALAFFLLMACSSDSEVKKEFKEFKDYVRSHADSVNEQTDERWDEIEREYKEKKARLSKHAGKMDETMRREIDSIEAAYDNARERYRLKRQRKQREDSISSAINSFTGNSPTDLNAKNLMRSYADFMRNFERDKEYYSKAEWERAEILWESLETRKKMIYSAFNGDDKLQLARYKANYIAAKTLYKVDARM